MTIEFQTANPGPVDRVSLQALLRLRAVVVIGSEEAGITIPGIYTPVTCEMKVRLCRANNVTARVLPLLAPYDDYEELDATINIVALHRHVDSGRLEAYGPFGCIEDAYDYFPDHSSPHDTLVTVFEVQHNQGEIAA